MKYLPVFGLCIVILLGNCVPAPEHPRIYITDKNKSQLSGKFRKSSWTQQSFNKIKASVDPYADRHRTDPEWIVSRLQMYWDTHYERIYVKGSAFNHGTGYAPVPTVKFAGHRDGATDYLMPSLEDTQPYMDAKGMYLQNGKKEGQPWEWVHPSKTGRMIGPMNERILRMAANAAFLYWFTGEEKYAVFAHDIFMTYVTGMYHRREPFALEDYGNSHLMGLATFEVILDNMIPQLAICYDFLYKYLRKKGADFNVITEVFKRWADQEIMYGVPDNNWNIFQARFVAYLALALEDDAHYPDRRGRQFYLHEIMNRTTIRQFALKEVMEEVFDHNTGLWPESATYSMSVCTDMLDVISLIDNAENNRLLDSFPIIRKAVPATAQYLLPNGRVTAFGDAKYVPLNANAFEMLAALYRKYGDEENEKDVTRVLRKLIRDSLYQRAGNTSLFPLIFYVDELKEIPGDEASYEHLLSDMYHAPNVSWLILRNGNDPKNGAAVTLVGSYGNHAHANGISMELFAKGLPLGPESSFGETYGTRDNQEYYARFPAHNTVCIDGISDYGMMRSYYPYKLVASYPANGKQLAPSDPAACAVVGFTEPRTDSRQERFAGIVRLNDRDSYIFDVFRSARNDGHDKKHEYFFHNAGHRVNIFARQGGSPLPLRPTGELSSAFGDAKGYDYFTNKKAVAHDGNFIARFNADLSSRPPVTLNVWMQGYPGRTIFTADAPKSNAFVKGSVPDELMGLPLPALIVRQDGEAWDRPFTAIYNAFDSTEIPAVENVTYFGGTSGFTGISVHSKDRVDHIFAGPRDDTVRHNNIRLKGSFAIVGESSGGVPLYLLLVQGERLDAGLFSIRTKAPGVRVALNRTDTTTFELTTTGATRLEIPLPEGKTPDVYDLSRPGVKVESRIEPGSVLTVELPEGRYGIK